MLRRFVRLVASSVVVAGTGYFLTSSEAIAAGPSFVCGQEYCISGTSCPSDDWLDAYCDAKACPGLPKCAVASGTCSGAEIVCNANQT